MRGGEIGEEERRGLQMVGQRVLRGAGAEVFDDEVTLFAECSCVGEDVRTLRVQVFVVAVDEGEGVAAQLDQRAHVVEDGGGVGLFLCGVDLFVVGVFSKPWVRAGSETTLSGAVPLHGRAGVVACDPGGGFEESFGGDFAGLYFGFIGVLDGDVVIVFELLEGIVGHAEFVAW